MKPRATKDEQVQIQVAQTTLPQKKELKRIVPSTSPLLKLPADGKERAIDTTWLKIFPALSNIVLASAERNPDGRIRLSARCSR
jgi:hypothetical protein